MTVPAKLNAIEKLSLCFDSLTNSLTVISDPHRETHEGETFDVEVTASAASGEYIEVLVTPPATGRQFHAIWEFGTQGQASFSVTEEVDTISGGVAGVPTNHNRNSALTSGSTETLVGDVAVPIVHANGSVIHGPQSIGSGQNLGGSRQRDEELILKAGVATVFRLTSLAAANVMWLEVLWYEHADSELQS